MAVDYKGQPLTTQTAFSTTGLMNQKPAKLKPLKMPKQEQQSKPRVVQQKPVENKPTVNLQNLKDDDKRILNIHLTPSLKNVFNRIFGQDIFPEFGLTENTVSIPKSIVVDRFGSLENFQNMIRRDDNNVPPSQGLMTSPQTNKIV